MNKRLGLLILVLFFGFAVWFFSKSEDKKSIMLNPQPTLTPAPTPKTFKYDAATNLKQELEKVNPQVLESDFE